jgi:Flp pilus assembly protein TadD
MRNLKMMLKAFVGVAAVSGLIGCEEADPPAKKIEPVVQAPIKVEAPKMVEAPKPIVAPKPVEAKPVETVKTEEPTVDEGSKPQAIIDGAREALGKGETDRALKLAELATKKAPSRSAAWNLLGRVQLQRGMRKDAIASFEKAVELNPKSSFAQNNLGLALIYDGRYDDAVDALEEATELEPVESYMFNNLGMAYEHLDRLEEAREAYGKAVELKNDRAKENLARLEGVKSVFRTAKIDSKKTEDVSTGEDSTHDAETH